MAAPVKPSLAAVEVTRGKRAAISIALISAVLGLPLWWKTTETYRAALPYSEISQLDTLQLQLSVPVEIIFTKGTLSVEQQRKLPSSGSKDKEVLLNSHTGFNCHYVIKYRIASIGEEETLGLPALKDADEALQQLDKGDLGSVSLYILAETSALFSEGINVYIGKYRRALVKYAVDQTDRIEDVLRTLNNKVQRVIQTMSFNEKAVTAALSDRISITQFNIEDLENIRRAFKSSPGYDLTFSLLNPDPKSLDLNWNISSASEQYIQPFLDKLSPVANFSVDSQEKILPWQAQLLPPAQGFQNVEVPAAIERFLRRYKTCIAQIAPLFGSCMLLHTSSVAPAQNDGIVLHVNTPNQSAACVRRPDDVSMQSVRIIGDWQDIPIPSSWCCLCGQKKGLHFTQEYLPTQHQREE